MRPEQSLLALPKLPDQGTESDCQRESWRGAEADADHRAGERSCALSCSNTLYRGTATSSRTWRLMPSFCEIPHRRTQSDLDSRFPCRLGRLGKTPLYAPCAKIIACNKNGKCASGDPRSCSLPYCGVRLRSKRCVRIHPICVPNLVFQTSKRTQQRHLLSRTPNLAKSTGRCQWAKTMCHLERRIYHSKKTRQDGPAQTVW